jgi:hypothetical protein
MLARIISASRVDVRLLKLTVIPWSNERDEDLPEVLQEEEATHGEQEVATNVVGEEGLQQDAPGDISAKG